MSKSGPRFTLSDSDIVSSRAVSRRSLLGGFGVGLGLMAAGLVANVGTARAQGGPRNPLDCTDNDGGPHEDQVGRGRNCRGGPDDGGPRRGQPPRRAEPPRSGQPPGAGCTDSDFGPTEDQAGYGRSCATNRRRTGCTDRDSGPNSDPPEFGTGCWI